MRGSANGSALLTASKKGLVVTGVDSGRGLAMVVAVMLLSVSGYAFGGQNSSGYPQQATNAYDPSADTWSGKSNMPGTTTRMGSCALGAACLATNGSSLSSPYTLTRALYKFESEAWATMTQSPTPAREQPTLQPLADKAYLCGGDTGAGGGLQDCDEYTVDSWASKTSMPTPARYGPGGGTIGSSVYVVGGRSGGGPWTYYTDCDQYTPDTWASVADMPAPARYRLASASLSDKLYAIGGETSTAQSRDCDEFDGSSWVSKTDMPLPARSGSGCFALESLVYVFGSVASGNDVDAFDPAADSWASKTNQTMYAFPGAGAPA
jgi:N-acetylneuraminic acid mutarotase